jgi:hypothetical protein
MKRRYGTEAEEWTTEGRKITEKGNLDAIRKALDADLPIIVRHSFYRGTSAPDYFIFKDYNEFLAYLDQNAYAGDAIDVWGFGAVCKQENRLAEGMCPDETGSLPKAGAA